MKQNVAKCTLIYTLGARCINFYLPYDVSCFALILYLLKISPLYQICTTGFDFFFIFYWQISLSLTMYLIVMNNNKRFIYYHTIPLTLFFQLF